MKVKLVSYTQGSDELFPDRHNIEDLVAFCARVSNPANQFNNDTSEKLINYLVKHKHWSPFEMVNVCLEIETTRDIARQILRHRSFSFQEFSQRYADVDALDMKPQLREARLQDTKNRQNSIETSDELLQLLWKDRQLEVWNAAEKAYRWAVDNGIAKEVARSVLPEGLTLSRLYVNGTLRSWIHYIDVRSSVETQKEHREIAVECAKVIHKLFPPINNFKHA
jgi:thymidylate synthase (FAD)